MKYWQKVFSFRVKETNISLVMDTIFTRKKSTHLDGFYYNMRVALKMIINNLLRIIKALNGKKSLLQDYTLTKRGTIKYINTEKNKGRRDSI